MNRSSPGGSARRLLDGLRHLDAKTPLLVGHEPLLSTAVSLAVCGGEAGAFEMKKAGLAWVEFDDAAARPRGLLQLLLSGAALRKLA